MKLNISDTLKIDFFHQNRKKHNLVLYFYIVPRHQAQLENHLGQHLVTLHQLKVVAPGKQMLQDGELIPPLLTLLNILPPRLLTIQDQEIYQLLPHRHCINHPTSNCRT